MNKTNDLIEKANARARSQNQGRSTGERTQLARSRQQEAEPSSFSRRRVKSGGGRVVVRRRKRKDLVQTPAPVVAEADETAVVETASVSTETVTPISSAAESATPVISEQSEPNAPVEAAAEESSSSVVETSKSPEVAKPEPTVASPAGSAEVPAPAVKAATPQVTPPAAKGPAKTAPAKVAATKKVQPKKVQPKKAQPKKAAPAKKVAPAPAAKTTTTRRRKAGTESAKVLYRPPPKPKPKPRPTPTPMRQEAAPKVEAPKPVQRPRRRVETRRSLEDVLAEERGYVPQQRQAMVVAPAPPTPARVARRPAPGTRPATGARPAVGTSALTPATPGAVGDRGRGKRPEVGGDDGGNRRRRRARSGSRGRFERDFHGGSRRRKGGRRSGGKKTQLTTPKAIKRIVGMEESITVGELAHGMSVKSAQVIKALMTMGVMANLNQSLDFDTASLIAQEFNFEVKNIGFDETEFIPELDDEDVALTLRAPVVTIMGHVDHGKTTLLDTIRAADVAGGEAGGITQHIGAYRVHTEGGDIVFLDTPGHEAFTAMRARGAEVTDIVILVVAADDGVMPQTIEAIRHAREADVPIIVAVNKIDKPGSQPEVIQRKLAEHNLVPEAWGGETIFVPVSAKQKTGIEDLLEMLLLQAEILELRANPDRPARASVIEAALDKGRGPVATVLVQTGTLNVGDHVVSGQFYGRVRAMFDENGVSLTSAGPSTPVQILGLNGVPGAGELFAVVKDSDIAKSIAGERAARNRSKELASSSKVSMEDLMLKMGEEVPEEVRLVVKADVQGSLQAVIQAFKGLSTDKVRVNIIQSGVGTISESDVMLAQTSGGVVVGFNVQADNNASKSAEQSDVPVHCHTIIYDALDSLRVIMTSKLPPILREKVLGHAEVRSLFSIPKIGVIAGSMVLDGKIIRNSMARLLRKGDKLWEGRLTSLKRFKDDAREVEKGFECGIGLESFTALEPEDIIESYMIEEVAPSL